MKQYLVIASLLVSATAHANDVDPNGFDRQAFETSTPAAQASAGSQAPGITGIDIDNDGRVVTAPSIKTRAQVQAETIEASRLGLTGWGGHDPTMGTADQENEVRMAGEQANGHTAASD